MNILDLIRDRLDPLRAEFATLSRLEESLVILAGLIAVYSVLHLFIIARHENVRARIETMRASIGWSRQKKERQAAAVRPWHERVGAILAASPVVGKAERARLGKLLADAGLTGPGRVATLMAAKAAGLAIAVFAIWSLMELRGLFANAAIIRFGVLVGAGLGGWRLADFIIGQLARRRRDRIEQGLPDALDLLVICAEAGLSLEQGINFVSREIAVAFPDVAWEFQVTAAELRVLGDRREALENLARRIGLPAVRSIVATLVQTMKYGTPLAHALRVLAAELRTTRLLRTEEKAAQLPVLLSIPLVAFILPCTFMVILSPAVLQIIDVFKNMNVAVPLGN